MNAELANQVEFLKKELDYERSNRVQIKFQAPKEELEDWQPVGGYKSLRQRIAEAEAASKEQAVKDADKIEEAMGKDATSSS